MTPERLAARLARLATRRPRRVLAVAAAVVLAALVLAAWRLELYTSNLDLIDPALPPVAAFLRFAEEFGSPNALVVVLEGEERTALQEAVDRLEPRLHRAPGVRSVLARLPAVGGPLAPSRPSYLSSRDGGLYFLFVQPDDTRSRADAMEPLVNGVRQVLDTARLDRLGVRAGLTGIPVYALDDRDVVQHDISRLSLLSFALVLLLFAVAFGSFWRPLLAMVALLAAVATTLGLVALYPGHLTLLSAFFASILFGLGVDFGIHLIDRVELEVAAGAGEAAAVERALPAVARGLLTGAVTTAGVFFVLLASGFRGFAELGVVAGAGVLVCLLAMTTVLPALLVVVQPRRRRRERPLGERRLGRFLLALQSRPLAVLLVVAAGAGLALGGPGFDTDYLGLQPVGSETVRLERQMVERSDYSPQFAAFVAPSRQRARQLAEQLRADSTVGVVRSVADLDLLRALGAQVPPELAASFESAGGRFAVYAYPKGDIWDPPQQREFLAHLRAIDPEVTGMPVLGQFMVDRSRRALGRSALLGSVALLLLVFLDFRRPAPTLLAVLPTFLTLAALPAVLRLAGLAFNPLNVMALPVVIGMAVDDGVHLVHRYLAEEGDLGRTLASTGRSVVLTSLTTLAAFGALVLTRHRGLASFASALSLGVALALVFSVLVLPQLLRLLGPRARGAAGERMLAKRP